MIAGCFSRSGLFAGRYEGPLAIDETFADGGLFVLDIGGIDNLDWTPQALALYPDGRIIIGGVGGTAIDTNFVAMRLDEAGAADATFGNGGLATVDFGYTDEVFEAVRVQNDGRVILAGGAASSGGADSVGAVARLLADGTLDPTFGSAGRQILDVLPGQDIPNGLVVLGDGRVRVCGQGWFDAAVGTSSDLVVYGLLADGTPETSFGNGGVVQLDFFGGDEFGGACVAGGGDTVLVPGHAWSGTDFDPVLARVDGDGNPDPPFGDDSVALPGRVSVPLAGSDEACDAVVRLADGRLLCGNGTSQGGSSDSLLVRFTAAGSVDATFGDGGRVVLDLGGNDGVRALQPLADGRIAVAGTRTNAAGDQDFALAFLTAAGRLDASAGSNLGVPGLYGFDISPGHDDEASALAVDGQGRLLVFGSTSDGMSINMALLRLWI